MEITQEMVTFAEAQKWDDDIRQDVYVILLEKPDGYMGDQTIESLMTAIYTFRKMDLFRQDSRRKALVMENLQAIENLHGTDGAYDPIEYVAVDELMDRVDKLSPLLKKTLYAHLNGVTVAAIAAHEEVDANTIYQRMHAIKRELHNGR